MSAAKKLDLVSECDYLANERDSAVKHEFLGGIVCAMAGARNRHNRIARRIAPTLWAQIGGSRCEPCDSDTKIRIQLPGQTRYYYPDASVVCEPNPEGDSFEDRPRVIFEVISASTRRIDEGEKKDAYLTIPSLAVYALIEQSVPAVAVFRRTPNGFVREMYEGFDAVVPLNEIGAQVPLARLYTGVSFPPETDDSIEQP